MVDVKRIGSGATPRVSVIIPCYNDGDTLGAAVESARAQERAELIVVNDGSTDERTLAIFGTLEASGVEVLHQPNAGLAAARMAGVHATTAPYVFPLDADDYLVPGALAKLCGFLDGHPEFALVWGNVRLVGERDHIRHAASALDPWLITYWNGVPQGSVIRRTALLQVGGWMPRGGYEDWDLWMAVANAGYAGRGLDTVVYHYRLHGPRMLDDAKRRHDHLFAEMRKRSEMLFAGRRLNRAHSNAPGALKLVVTAIDPLPVPTYHTKLLVYSIVSHLANRRGGYRRISALLLRRAMARLSSVLRDRLDASKGQRSRPERH